MPLTLGGLGYAGLLLVILRIGTGAGLIAHGYPKAAGGRVQAGQWMKSLGVPAVTADFATVLEFIGGIFVIAGFLTPLVGLFMVLQFGSITLVKISKMKAKFVTSDRAKPSYELDVLYLMLGLVLLFLGAGPFSLDNLFGI